MNPAKLANIAKIKSAAIGTIGNRDPRKAANASAMICQDEV
jgi:hypothetical protein